MKNIIRVLGLIIIVISLMLSTAAFAVDGIRVLINGEPIEFDVQPQLINDRTMVPLRAIFETLGAEVEWNGDTRTVTATRDDIVVVSTIESKTMYVNGEAKIMDVAPVIIDDRTLVPARFIAEAFGCDVQWDGSDRTVYISTGSGFEADEDDFPDDNGGFVDDDDEIVIPPEEYED